MRVVCFSSFTFGYLNRARVLFSSLRRHQPTWKLVALITDEPPSDFAFDVRSEPFDELLYAHDLGIDAFRPWLFKHDVVEVCTAVKGPFAWRACSADYDAVVYLDPDTAVFDSLDPIEELLESFDIVLTPHQLQPDDDDEAIVDNEIMSLRTGIYNLGFIAFRTSGEGARFARWWADRLLRFCYDDVPSGLFVDQRWCDHVPGLFENVKILRDPGYNVASWNLSNRTVAVDRSGMIRVNGSPLRFWHFTKLGRLGDTMTKKYAKDNFPVYELWNWYRREVTAATDPAIPSGYWAYERFASGTRIDKGHRVLYRDRTDLQKMFGDPYASGPGTYHDWLRNEGLLPVSES
jgi:hypothetical protein